MNFTSIHPAKVLRGIVQCLKVREEKVCDKGKQWQEIQLLKQVFIANDYLESVVKSSLRGRSTSTNTNVESEIPQAPTPFLCQRSQQTKREDVLTALK